MKHFPKNNFSINLRSLDALRGALALYVVLGHCRWLLWAGHREWGQYSHSLLANILAYASASLRYGHEAVMFFFALSGFFIHLRASKALAQNQSFNIQPISYFQRRCHRLIPPYIFALLLTVTLDLLGRSLFPTLYTGQTSDSFLNSNFLRKTFSLDSVLPAIVLLPGVLGKDFGTNGTLWSLTYEVVYYLLYPLWLLLRRSGIWLAYSGGMSFAVLLSYFLHNSFASAIFSHYVIWLSGAAVSEFLIGKQIDKKKILFSSLLLLSIALIISKLYIPQLFIILCYALMSSIIVFVIAILPNEICNYRLHYLLERIGIESYTIYICHFPIIALLSAFLFETFGGRPLHGWFGLGGAVIALTLCHFCFLICERHFLHSRLRV